MPNNTMIPFNGFNSSLNPRQLKALAELFNHQCVFLPEVDADTLAALFACRLKSPLVVRNARTLCYIFNSMSKELLITPIWQAVAEQTKCFISLKGKPISRNTLSSANYCAANSDIIDGWTIEEYVRRVKYLITSNLTHRIDYEDAEE